MPCHIRDTVTIYGYLYKNEVSRIVTPEQQPFEALDMSFILRTVMAARSLTASEMASKAGVSKSAMEEYLAGPSSPRAVAVASLSRSSELSADTLMFGEIDKHIEIAYQPAFEAFAQLPKDLKSDPELSDRFTSFDPGTDEFSDFVRNLPFERTGSFKRNFNQNRRYEQTIISLR